MAVKRCSRAACRCSLILNSSSAMADIFFTCPKCGQNLVVDEAGAGLKIDCPTCSRSVVVSSVRPSVVAPGSDASPSQQPNKRDWLWALGVVIGCAIFAGGCLWMARAEDATKMDMLVGWVGFVFFGGGAFAIILACSLPEQTLKQEQALTPKQNKILKH